MAFVLILIINQEFDSCHHFGQSLWEESLIKPQMINTFKMIPFFVNFDEVFGLLQLKKCVNKQKYNQYLLSYGS